jgi:16S rRNA (cytidine1402-2'-O)-methyltransferase
MLYICPTPIGNLEDITLRTLRILKEVDVIACEDTRHTLKLLNHYEIKKKLISYHEHNKTARGPELIAMVESGVTLAVVSDAGMPGLSDPGSDLISLAIDKSVPYTVLPGANALLPALVGSGLSTERFLYVGFLEANATKRRRQLDALALETPTLIFYEAPHRLLSTLRLCRTVFGLRKAVVVRELSKKFETFHRGNLEELVFHFEAEDPRGEIVIVIEGHSTVVEVDLEESIEAHLIRLMTAGLSKKDATKQVAKERQLKKQEVYMVAATLEEN